MLTSRPTRIALTTLLALLLAACGQSATASVTGKASSARGAAVSGVAGPQSSAVAEPSAAPSSVPEPTTRPSTPAAAASSAPVPANDSALDAISAAYKASLAATSYRVESTITSGSTTSMIQTFEVMLPNRLHRTMNSEGNTSETIIIDATTYSRVGEGEWLQSTDSTGALDILKKIGADPATIEQLTTYITDAEVIGPDTLDGKPMTVYQYKLTFKVNDAGAESSSVVKMWVGTDSLPYKLESDSSSNITGKMTSSHLVNLYSDYNADFAIVAPVPQH